MSSRIVVEPRYYQGNFECYVTYVDTCYIGARPTEGEAYMLGVENL